MSFFHLLTPDRRPCCGVHPPRCMAPEPTNAHHDERRRVRSRRLTVVVDDTVFRHDILNDDVRRVHPDLPTTPGSRGRHLAECDARAYETIRREYPGFRPPGWVGERGCTHRD